MLTKRENTGCLRRIVATTDRPARPFPVKAKLRALCWQKDPCGLDVGLDDGRLGRLKHVDSCRVCILEEADWQNPRHASRASAERGRGGLVADLGELSPRQAESSENDLPEPPIARGDGLGSNIIYDQGSCRLIATATPSP